MATTQHAPRRSSDSAPDDDRARSIVSRLVGRVTGLEWGVAGLVALVVLVLVVLEPDILEAPFENEKTVLFTVGATVVATIVAVAMLWWRVPPVVRILVLWVPFVAVSWWLISPFFIDDVVEDEFATSIAAALDDPVGAGEAGAVADAPVEAPPPTVAAEPTAEPGVEGAAEADVTPDPTVAPETSVPAEPVPAAPVLLGAGQFVGLAGHSGTGDAGIFENPDGSLVLRLENFDIQNGPDLELYVVVGADQTSPAAGSIHLGSLRGNVGNQTYDLPAGTELASGPHTVLVWCEAFSVEFVGATLTV